jgi:hypothetical protein
MPRIWRRMVSGSGIPGVGVAPGFIILFASFGSGIPGVGVAPFGSALTAFAAGIPGVDSGPGTMGDPENSGGTGAELELAAVFEFDGPADWQPNKQAIAANINIPLSIKQTSGI